VTGMSCAACQARVEKAVSAVPGVCSCAVSLLTNSMGVEGTAESAQIIAAVEAAGYGAALKGAGEKKQSTAEAEDALKDRETPLLKKRLIASVGFLVVLMYFSMGHMMWGWPLPGWFEGNHVAMGLVQLLLAGIVMVINQKFFISGFRGLMHRSPNMDTLVAMGSAASFLWSVYALFMMTDAVVRGDQPAVMVYMDEFYFESAAMILTLITVGKMLEARSKGKTTDALKGLMKLAPRTAIVLRDEAETEVPVEEIAVGDVFILRPGSSVPVDGVILEGSAALDESALTGESIPADKEPGDKVSAGTVNKDGFVRCRASRIGEDTSLSQIIRMVSDAAATKAPIAKLADKVAGVFVPAVLGIALVTLLVWLAAGKEFSFALARAISVLVISCPCSLGLATPVAIMVGNGMGARKGVLFKTAAALESAGRIQIVALDKTGTITEGHPVVTDVRPFGAANERELVTLAAALEASSEHPLAKAVNDYAAQQGIEKNYVNNFKAVAGNGLSGEWRGKQLVGGSLKYISRLLSVGAEETAVCEEFSAAGKTPLLFAADGVLQGVIAVADRIKPDSRQAIEELKGMGIKTVMLTGDNKRTAAAIGAQAGVDGVIAGVLPDGKERVIRKLSQAGKVAMIGDGINDAPALTAADLGIAIGAGTDVAIDAADVVLVNSALKDASAAIRLGRATLKNIKENLFWAFFYNCIGIPIAAGVLIPAFGIALSPMIGAAAMSLSSFCVVSNALRLNLKDIYDPKHDRTKASPSALEEIVTELSEEKEMNKTMKISGMMCPHCEARVKKTLEGLEGVASAEVSFSKGTAIVTLTADVANSVLSEAVTAQGYDVLSVE
ncbi:MAG: heavy metal translocating P-type ATPase, partial [Oscillospiraceae bacterium]|nr:heavy metal translocating P-type ATPase [Oscillospiraceae bacterium]